MATRVMSKDMQEILNEEDCEDMDPGSGSIHTGIPSRRAPTSLSIQNQLGAHENSEPEQSSSGTHTTIHTMPDMSSTGLKKLAPGSSVTATANLVTSMTSPSWSGTSWTGGLTQGCTSAFKTSASVNDIGTATTSVPLSSPAGSLDGSNLLSSSSRSSSPSLNKLESLRSWTVSTYKISRQSLFEKLGKTSKTVDCELESQIESLRDTQRRYSNILRLARALTSHLYHVIHTQAALSECFGDLANKSPELQDDFLCNSESQRNLSKNGQQLVKALNFFVSSVNTLCNKTMEDTIATIRQYETARIEFDAYRNDMDFYTTAPKTEVNLSKSKDTEEMFLRQKQEFEKLRSDVQIKLKFLDENRVKVMHKQLMLFHNAVSAYFSGNQAALEATMKQFNINLKTPNSTPPSWVEQ